MSHFDFGIYKIPRLASLRTDIYQPTRKGFYTILFSGKAGYTHHLDGEEVVLPPYSVLFVGPAAISQFDKQASEDTYVLIFSSAFFGRSNRDLYFLQNSTLFNDYGKAYVMALPEGGLEYGQVTVYLLYQARDGFVQQLYQDLAHNLIEQVLIMGSIHHQQMPFANYKENQDGYLVVEFKKLLAAHFHSEKTIQFYADTMNITGRRLNKATETVLGMGAKDVITTRILEEAKRLLRYSDWDIKEISENLGFSGQQNFSAFFMNNTNIRPKEFRKKNGL